jgi:hypothetical protein
MRSRSLIGWCWQTLGKRMMKVGPAKNDKIYVKLKGLRRHPHCVNSLVSAFLSVGNEIPDSTWLDLANAWEGDDEGIARSNQVK